MNGYKLSDRRCVRRVACRLKLVLAAVCSLFVVSSPLQANADISKWHREAIKQKCSVLVKQGEYRSMGRCKNDRLRKFRKQREFLSFKCLDKSRASHLRIACHPAKKRGIIDYDNCLVKQLIDKGWGKPRCIESPVVQAGSRGGPSPVKTLRLNHYIIADNCGANTLRGDSEAYRLSRQRLLDDLTAKKFKFIHHIKSQLDDYDPAITCQNRAANMEFLRTHGKPQIDTLLIMRLVINKRNPFWVNVEVVDLRANKVIDTVAVDHRRHVNAGNPYDILRQSVGEASREVHQRLAEYNKGRLNVFNVTLERFNSNQQTMITDSISALDGYRFVNLRLATGSHWSGQLETPDDAPTVRNKISRLISKVAGHSPTVSGTRNGFVIKNP
jgi:hypothetical protein